MLRFLKIDKTIHYCEDCPYCTWVLDDNTGWVCMEKDYRLILTKEDYDASDKDHKHVYIPHWCPLENPEAWTCPKCGNVYKGGPYYLCTRCDYKDPKYYDFRWCIEKFGCSKEELFGLNKGERK